MSRGNSEEAKSQDSKEDLKEASKVVSSNKLAPCPSAGAALKVKETPEQNTGAQVSSQGDKENGSEV